MSLVHRHKAGSSLNAKQNPLSTFIHDLQPPPPYAIYNNEYNNVQKNPENSISSGGNASLQQQQQQYNNNQYIDTDTSNSNRSPNKWNDVNKNSNYLQNNNIQAANLPPSVLTPFFQQVNFQQRPNKHFSNNNNNNYHHHDDAQQNNDNKTQFPSAQLPRNKDERKPGDYTTIPTATLSATVQSFIEESNEDTNLEKIANENKYFYNTGSEFIKASAPSHVTESHYHKKNLLTVYREVENKNNEKINLSHVNKQAERYPDATATYNVQGNFKPSFQEHEQPNSNLVWSTFAPFLPTPVHMPFNNSVLTTAMTSTDAQNSIRVANVIKQNIEEHEIAINNVAEFTTAPPDADYTTPNVIESSTTRHRSRTKLRRRRPKPSTPNAVSDTSDIYTPRLPNTTKPPFIDREKEITKTENKQIIVLNHPSRGKIPNRATTKSPESDTIPAFTTTPASFILVKERLSNHNRSSLFHSQISEAKYENSSNLDSIKKLKADNESKSSEHNGKYTPKFVFNKEPQGIIIPSTTFQPIPNDKQIIRTKLRKNEKYPANRDSINNYLNSNDQPDEANAITQPNLNHDNSRTTTTTAASPTATKSTPVLKKLYDSKNRPRFSVKDYRQKTTTIEDTVATTTMPSHGNGRLKFPSRNKFNLKNATETTTQFKDDENVTTNYDNKKKEKTETVINTKIRIRQTTTRPPSTKTSTNRSRDNVLTTRRTYKNRITTAAKNEENLTTLAPPKRTTPDSVHSAHHFNSTRQRYHNNNNKSSLANIAPATIKSNNGAFGGETTTGAIESAIMKIAKDNHSYRPQTSRVSTTSTTESPETPSNEIEEDYLDLNSASSDYSQKVTELTISGNTNDKFKSVNTGMFPRRIPGYFTLATEDPILPIEAFFPQFKSD